MTALLLAEPEPATRGFLAQQLTSDGFDVLPLRDPREAPRTVLPDIVVLGDPEALARCTPGCPVIVLGPDDGPYARARVLEAGCDDYVVRPFVYEELLARIRAVLRRMRRDDSTVVGALEIDRVARRVRAAGIDVPLSVKEFSLLSYLATDPNRVFTREQLLRDVWGIRAKVLTRTIESHASRVRRKLEAAGAAGYVVNVWGVGYKLI